MSKEFYLKDFVHKNIKNEDVVESNKLFFRFDKAGFDGVATKEHVAANPGEFQAFLDANPDFVLPESFSAVAVKIGEPVVKEAGSVVVE